MSEYSENDLDFKIRTYKEIDDNDIGSFEDFEDIYSIREKMNDDGEPEELNFE